MNAQELKIRWMASPSYALYGKAAGHLRSLLRGKRWQGWICSGFERAGGQPFKLAYAGSRLNKNYIQRTLYSEAAKEEPLGLLAPQDFLRRARVSFCDLAIMEARPRDPFFQTNKTHFRIPVWIPQRLDVSGDIERLNHRESLRSLRRRLRKNALTFAITQDPRQLKDFYTNFYVPFTSKNHQGEAFIHPFHEVLARARQGEMLLAYQGVHCVGGNLLEYTQTEGRLSFIGVKEELVREGVISAITLGAILRIKERGLETVNMGDSRGLLKDGSLRFKAGLGCIVSAQDPQNTHCWTLEILRQGPGLENVLAAHPFISLDANGDPWGVFFTRSPDEPESSVRPFVCGGLKGVKVYSSICEGEPVES